MHLCITESMLGNGGTGKGDASFLSETSSGQLTVFPIVSLTKEGSSFRVFRYSAGQ